MNHVDLFSGIGGFALACRWNGIETIQFVEIDSFCQKVLQKNFPGVPIHDDIKTFKWDGRPVFLLTGGFPCQPFSVAGKQKGKEDDRALWPEMFRIIKEVKPRWIIGENVAGFINMGLDESISNLESEGYEVQAFIIPACAVNAPHRRDRVWICAHSNNSSDRTRRGTVSEKDRISGINRATLGSGMFTGTDCHAPNGTGDRLQERGVVRERQNNVIARNDEFVANCECMGWTEGARQRIEHEVEITERQESGNGDSKGTRSHSTSTGLAGICKSKFHESILHAKRRSWQEDWIEVATRLCRVDDGVRNRVDRLKGLGNAIVPQIAFAIIKVILEVEKGNV